MQDERCPENYPTQGTDGDSQTSACLLAIPRACVQLGEQPPRRCPPGMVPPPPDTAAAGQPVSKCTQQRGVPTKKATVY